MLRADKKTLTTAEGRTVPAVVPSSLLAEDSLAAWQGHAVESNDRRNWMKREVEASDCPADQG